MRFCNSVVCRLPATKRQPYPAVCDSTEPFHNGTFSKGREAVRGIAAHRYAFKTPSLRNITLTAPYMHNGVYATLDEVMKFYNVGGGAGIGLEIPNQTLPPKPLGLSSYERLSLVAFLHSLTDTTATVHTPTSTHIPSTHARSIHSMLVKP